MAKNQQQSAQQAEFVIQKVYVKDASFESPHSPEMFMQKWEPRVNLDLTTSNRNLDAENYEVIVKVTVTVAVEDKNAFLIEVQQAGVFTAKNFPQDQMGHLLGSFCPNILFPYAREMVSDLAVRGGFPQLLLSPVNFDALYQEQQQKAAANANASSETVN